MGGRARKCTNSNGRPAVVLNHAGTIDRDDEIGRAFEEIRIDFVLYRDTQNVSRNVLFLN